MLRELRAEDGSCRLVPSAWPRGGLGPNRARYEVRIRPKSHRRTATLLSRESGSAVKMRAGDPPVPV
jgi:hypothetical protein